MDPHDHPAGPAISRLRANLRQLDDAMTASAPESGGWRFDDQVTAAFEDMLVRSIPNYEGMREIVTRSADWVMDRVSFGSSSPAVWDLGASRGSALAPLVDRWGARAHFRALEISPPMVAALRERFEGMIEAGVVEVTEWDLREGLPTYARRPSVILSVLTLQFVPIEYRHRILREAYELLPSGGAMIVVEKVLGENDQSNRLLVDVYHGLKRENGYEQEAIDRKRLALEGVLVPVTAAWNEQLFRSSGFQTVEQIWAWANFRGWLCVRR